MHVFKVLHSHRSGMDRWVGGVSVASNSPPAEIGVVFGRLVPPVRASRIAGYRAMVFHAVCFELSEGELSFIHRASVECVRCMLAPKAIENT